MSREKVPFFTISFLAVQCGLCYSNIIGGLPEPGKKPGELFEIIGAVKEWNGTVRSSWEPE